MRRSACCRTRFRSFSSLMSPAPFVMRLEGVAWVPDIEGAVRRGLGYPQGPLAWGDHIGGARVLEILKNIQANSDDPRYRLSPWRLRRDSLDLLMLTPDVPRQ
jgi:3-hydroxybutyryl-CoA dehydrogenase